MGTWNGIGTTYISATRRDAEGKNHVIEWFVLFGMPIIPLGRYHVKKTGYRSSSTSTSSRTVTSYQLLGGTGLKFWEVIGTYLFFWILSPAVVIGVPVGLGTLVGVLGLPSNIAGWILFIGFLAAVIGWIFLYLKWEEGANKGN